MELTRLRLTSAQVVMLEWDRIPFVKSGKGWREYDVDDETLATVREVAETLSWGSDCVTAAKALLRKVNQIRKCGCQP